MKKDIAVSLQNISKVYKLYDKPIDRLKESLNPFKKSYHKDFYALKNINLEIKKGEVLGIVGVNGAGKSTLLKIISGVLTPTTGRVNIHGRINAILELGSSLKPEMTGRENIKLNLQINGIEKDREKITDEIIEFADIGEHIDQPIKSYSSGMKARLGFGIATSTDPDILIVDEVLAVGDVLFQRQCYSKIEKLFKDGKTVIFVSHNAQSVIEFCSRAILLYDREIIMDDTPKRVTDYYQKLVFSKDKQNVLDEIDNNNKIVENKKSTKSTLKTQDTTFLKTLVSDPISLNLDVAEFSSIYIYDNENKVTNQLINNNTYTLEYNVLFKKDMKNVSIGWRIKSLKGQLITGIHSKNIGRPISNIKKGMRYNIRSDFNCLLLPGVYFIKVSTVDELNNCASLDDVLIFKVLPLKENLGGFVSLNQTLEINEMRNNE